MITAITGKPPNYTDIVTALDAAGWQPKKILTEGYNDSAGVYTDAYDVKYQSFDIGPAQRQKYGRNAKKKRRELITKAADNLLCFVTEEGRYPWIVGDFVMASKPIHFAYLFDDEQS